MRQDWIKVDLDGLSKLLERRGKEFAIFELAQNSWDERVTRVDVRLTKKADELYWLEVEDDAAQGFQDLSDAYTLFAESKKKPDPTKRGIFNAGEKLVLALCQEALITTTTGTVLFGAKGRAVTQGRRPAGSLFQGLVKLTDREAREIGQAVHRLIPPVPTYFNGDEIPRRTPLRAFQATLPTTVSDETGAVRRVSRKTEIRLYEVLPDEEATMYEMGIPVVEIGDKWHVDIGQRVPLNSDRDNVPPGFLKQVRVLVLNEMADRLERPDATAPWVREASGDERATDAAVNKVADLAFGPKRVAFDLSDPEANALAFSEGYAVVSGGSLSGRQWANIKRAGAILPAGQVTPSPKPDSPEGSPQKTVPEHDWSDGMRWFARFAQETGTRLIGITPAVRIIRDPGWPFQAAYGAGRLTVNENRVGKAFFRHGASHKVIGLLIHEFAHHIEGNHLDARYHDALQELGAKFTRLALKEPALFQL